MTMDDVSRAWDLIRAESSIWAIAPSQLDALAARMASTPGNADEFWYRAHPSRDLAAADRRKAMPAPSVNAAVIPIVGPLVRRGGFLAEMFGLASYAGIRNQLAQAVADPSVDRIVLYVDSPGGSCLGCEETATDIVGASRKKPVSAFVDGLCGSAAFWLASGASHVTASPSSEIGSVGVYALHVSMAGALEQAGIAPQYITSKVSPFKTEGNSFESLAPDAKARIQRDVDAIAAKFVGAVARGRGVSVETVRADFGKGRMLFAADAKAAKMIDAVGSIEDLLRSESNGNRSALGRQALLQELRRGTSVDARQRRLELLKA
jgi:signal peptide peptidase SppA